MASSALVEAKIKDGKRVIDRLDKAGIVVTAAFWYYIEDAENWRLIIATPLVESEGPRAAYAKIHDAQWERRPARLRKPILGPSEITAVGSNDPLVKLLSMVIRTGPNDAGVRFSRNVINGTYIEDAYIYRLSNPVGDGFPQKRAKAGGRYRV